MIVVGNVTAIDGLTQVLRGCSLPQRSVEAGGLILQEAGKRAEVELAIGIRGSQLIVL